MTDDQAEAIALHRWAVIAEAANSRLGSAERGRVVRAAAARTHAHPDGSQRRYSRNTLDRWIRAWRSGGLEALRPVERADAGAVREHPELFEEAAALRLELPARSAAGIAEILWHRHGVRVAERTLRAQLRRRGLSREALAAEPKAFGRYEAERPNERWITDVLVGPWVPHPRVDASVRAKLFLIVDDHSRLLVHGRFMAAENTRAGQDVLRAAIVRRGLPEVLYADNGAPFSNAMLARTCAVLGIRLVHSAPYSPEGRGKQERLNRYIRERFITEATHVGIDSLHELNDRFAAWVDQVANRRTHAETGMTPRGPLRRRRAAPGRRARPPRRGLPLVGPAQGDPHRNRQPGRQPLLRRPRPGRQTHRAALRPGEPRRHRRVRRGPPRRGGHAVGDRPSHPQGRAPGRATHTRGHRRGLPGPGGRRP